MEFAVYWLEHPDSSFERMKVEDDDERNGFLDDVRLDQVDGGVVVRQVKFATHPEEDPWDWRALLAQRSGRRAADRQTRVLPSLLQKWAQTWRQLAETYPMVDAAVVTNRHAAPDLQVALEKIAETDPAFHSVRRGASRVNFDAIENGAVRRAISAQLGGEHNARAFFASFGFELEHPTHEGLNVGLLRRLSVLGCDGNGWNNLQAELRRWVRNSRQEPAAGGSIALAHVRHAAQWYKLQSMPQDFVIPSDYVVPDESFHDDFVRHIKGVTTGCLVLEASPGAGKSTYCSALFRQMETEGTPVVRHHYFLSLSDPRANFSPHERLDFRRAAESLMHDLQAKHRKALGNLASHSPAIDNLGNWVERIGGYYADQNKSIVIILDGLDHVWRERRSIDELRLMLEVLLPPRRGVVLVLATQPIAESLMPLGLARAAPREGDRKCWFRLPFLHLGSVRQWLAHHATEILHEYPRSARRRGRPRQSLNATGELSEGEIYELGRLAEAFFRSSQGHPLHLRFSLKSLQDRGIGVTEHAVGELPNCPHEDIAHYYRLLELTLPEEGRRILHLFAISLFPWTRQGLLDCLAPEPVNQSRVIEALRQVEHLLVHDELGFRAFHRSLLVWLRDQPAHSDYAPRLRRQTLDWLTSGRAPEAWRWAYEWVLRADSGDVAPLRDGPDREWTIRAVAERRRGPDLEAILARAGWYALEDRNLARALELGLLADYAHNTLHYMRHVLVDLLPTQLAIGEDPYLRSRLNAERSECMDLEVAHMAEAAWRDGDGVEVKRCFGEIVHRIRAGRLRSAMGSEGDWDEAVDALTRIYSLLSPDSGELERFRDFVIRQRGHDTRYGDTQRPQNERICDLLGRYCTASGNLPVLRLLLAPSPARKNAAVSADASSKTRKRELNGREKSFLLRSAVLSAIEERISIEEILLPLIPPAGEVRTLPSPADVNPFVALYFLIRSGGNGASARLQARVVEWPDDSVLQMESSALYSAKVAARQFIYHAFFAFLANEWLERSDENSAWLAAVRQRSAYAWPRRFLGHLHGVAADAASLLREGHSLPYEWIFDQLGDLEPAVDVDKPSWSREGDDRFRYAAYAAGVEVGSDFWVLVRGIEAASELENRLSLSSVEAARKSPFCKPPVWLQGVLERRRPILPAEEAQRWLEEQGASLRSRVTVMNERAEEWASLAAFASLHGLRDLAGSLVRESAACLVSHYWSKEVSFFGLLDSIGRLFEALPPEYSDERGKIREWIADLAGPTAEIMNFTDGDETNHLPTELAEVLAVVSPQWLPAYFGWLAENENYSAAESAFEEWLKVADLAEPISRSVAATAVGPHSIKILARRASAGDANAGSIVEAWANSTGGKFANVSTEDEKSEAPSAEETFGVECGNYPPDRVGEFLGAVREAGAYDIDLAVERWLDHWGAISPIEAAESMSAALKLLDYSRGKDALFASVLRSQGKAKAYPLLVEAQRDARGWYYYYSSRENALARAGAIREHYPEKWFDYILDTARGPLEPWEGSPLSRISMGYQTWSHLTQYLLVQGQWKAAFNAVEQMVKSALEATSSVPLSRPTWVHEALQLEPEGAGNG